MKKGIFLLVIIMAFSPIKANNQTNLNIGVNNYLDNSITFYERGVRFHVFLNGDFDFNTHTRRLRYSSNRGVRIDRDYHGKIRRIGNVFINYDYRGNVARIGNVFMSYRSGTLVRVGNLRISYNRWGEPYFTGSVKGYQYGTCDYGTNVNIGVVYDYNDQYFYRRDFRNNYHQFKEDSDFYYYRLAPNVKKGKRSNIIRRRKNRRTQDNTYYYKNNAEREYRKSRRSE